MVGFTVKRGLEEISSRAITHYFNASRILTKTVGHLERLDIADLRQGRRHRCSTTNYGAATGSVSRPDRPVSTSFSTTLISATALAGPSTIPTGGSSTPAQP